MSEAPRSARVLGAIGRGLITAGVVVLLFVVFQLWGTNLQEARAQDGLRDEFDGALTDAQTRLAALEAEPGAVDAGGVDDDPDELPAPVPSSTLPGGLTEEVLRYFFPDDGDAVARIEIPSIGVDKIVVSGVQVEDLRKGPGQYPGTATVGTEGNTSIAGHRTTYGAPFNRIDELVPGDEIHVTGVLGRFTYRVMEPTVAYPEQIATVDAQGGGHIIVRPTATWVLDDFTDNRVTLTACHPKLSSRQRIIVAAELVDAPADTPAFDPSTLVGLGDEDGAPTIAGEDGLDDDTERTVPAPTLNDLDEGLDGDRSAIPGAVAWMAAATALWVLAGLLGRHLFDLPLRRAAVRVVALVPVGLCLWFSFELIDRALPAG